MQNYVIGGTGYDPWRNLALEELLFERQGLGATLYLWQNESTVVIGKHQNAWKECRTALLEREGGKLARRSSGGGAVYHDLGNLNFTFLMPREAYSVPRQLSVIRAALGEFGIETMCSGRNDLVLRAAGAKCSGSAFRLTDTTAMHHGTLLVDVDMERLGRYLAPSPQKLAAKGVESVRARVRNLRECCAGITAKGIGEALRRAFAAEYGPAETLSVDGLDAKRLAALEETYGSWGWRYGKTPAFDLELYHRFSWGEVTLLLSVQQGCVTAAHCYSDAMDAAFIERVAPALTGAPMEGPALGRRLEALGGEQGRALGAFLRSTSL